LNLATVYRTLETLHEAEMVDLFFQEGESLQFALRDPTHPHGHLFCQCCGKMIELDLTVLESARDTIWQQYGFRLESDHISLRGQCDECLGDSQKIGGK
jgi:Fe2+ or Zn2+ uptake regulation protein